MYKKVIYIAAFIFIVPCKLWSVTLDDAFYMNILNQMRNLKSTAYDYMLEVKFSDSTTEKVNGKSYFDAEKSFIYNSNKAATILYNGEWFLNINHLKKQVVIYALNKRFRASLADSMKNEIFQMGVYTEWIDSVVKKYGRFANGKMISKNVVKFDILFKPNDMVQSISMEYDISKGLPVNCTIISYYSSEFVDDTETNVVQVMKCTNYQKKVEGSDYDIHSYFDKGDESGKNIKLKKFKNYKLITIK